jgi:hypothetical protein
MEVAMLKISVTTRVISFAVLITFLLASFPTTAGAAKTNNRGLETKWAKLVAIYERQSIIHDSAPRLVERWLSYHRKAPASKKAELQRDLARSNTAWAPVLAIVMRHNGFDANGNVVDKAAAQQSVKDP